MRDLIITSEGSTEFGIMILMDYTYGDLPKDIYSQFKTFKKIIDNNLTFENENYFLEDFYSAYCIKKPLRNRRSLSYNEFKEQFQDWKELLIDEINRIQPKVILALGSNVSKLLTGLELNKTIGDVCDFKSFDKKIDVDPKIITCYNPRYCETQVNNYGNTQPFVEFSEALDKCFHISFGNTEALEINYTQHKLVESVKDFDQLIEYIQQTGICSFDYETTGLEWYDEEIYATVLSISFQVGSAWIIPLYHGEPVFVLNDKGEPKIKGGKYEVDYLEDPIFDNETIQYFFDELEDKVFDNPDIIKIAHNSKFDMHWNLRHGMTRFSGRLNDTMLMSHILNELTPNGLKDLTREYFKKYSNYEKALKRYSWASTPLKILARYAGIDTDITLRLWLLFERELIEDDDQSILYLLYRNLTMPSFFALLHAEHHGAKIDRRLIEDSIRKAEKIIDRKLDILLGFKEVVKFQNYKRRQVNKKSIKEFEDKISARKALVKKKLEEKTEKVNKEIDDLDIDLGKFDPDSKEHIKILKKINTKEKMLISYSQKLNEIDQDRFVINYEKQVRDIKSGLVDTYKGFNLDSPKQLEELLFTQMGFDFAPFEVINYGRVEYVKSTSADLLKNIDHPFIDQLFIYRSISKMVSTYYKGILKRLDKNDYLHTSFLLHGTKTGRLSSRNPNFQNIPSRSKLDDKDAVECLKMVKKFFIPISDDYYVIQADYSQAELRLIANFSGDPIMQDTYMKNIDIHTMTASKLSGKEYEEFLTMDEKFRKKKRNDAKGANFGLVYDISIEGYQDYCKKTFGLVLSYDEASTHYNIFFDTYKKLKTWHKEYVEWGRMDGYVRTLFGRKRHLPFINGGSPAQVSADERYSINSPIQGTGGEYTMFSFALLRHRLPKEVIFFNTVHDSIFFYVPKEKEKFQYYMGIIREACEHPPIEDYFHIEPQNVPMKIDVEVSEKSWGDMEEKDDDFLYKNSNKKAKIEV